MFLLGGTVPLASFSSSAVDKVRGCTQDFEDLAKEEETNSSAEQYPVDLSRMTSAALEPTQDVHF